MSEEDGIEVAPKYLATVLETVYESDYNLEDFKIEIIDVTKINGVFYFLIKYVLKGDLTMMPGILTKIDSITTKELRENLRILWDEDMEHIIDQFQETSEETKTKIKNGLFIQHSFLTKNLRREFLKNPIKEKTDNVEAEFFNIVESDYGKIEFMFENNAILPVWKK